MVFNHKFKHMNILTHTFTHTHTNTYIQTHKHIYTNTRSRRAKLSHYQFGNCNLGDYLISSFCKIWTMNSRQFPSDKKRNKSILGANLAFCLPYRDISNLSSFVPLGLYASDTEA